MTKQTKCKCIMHKPYMAVQEIIWDITLNTKKETLKPYLATGVGE